MNNLLRVKQFPARISCSDILDWFVKDPMSLMTTPAAVAAIRLAAIESHAVEMHIRNGIAEEYEKE